MQPKESLQFASEEIRVNDVSSSRLTKKVNGRGSAER